jgi:hypothetical protein
VRAIHEILAHVDVTEPTPQLHRICFAQAASFLSIKRRTAPRDTTQLLM